MKRKEKKRKEKIEKPKVLKNAFCLEQKTTVWKKFKHSSGKKWNNLEKIEKMKKKRYLIPGSQTF